MAAIWCGRSRRPDTHRQTAAAAIRIAAVCDRRGAIRAIQQTLAVPVSIIFDQLPLHEMKLMPLNGGVPEKPENARWLLSYARGLRHRLGRIYINFGLPVPLYERMVALRAEGLTDRQVVERIALDICHRLNQATPVTATAAVCVAMLGEGRALTLDEVCATVAPLARYLRARGWPVAGAPTSPTAPRCRKRCTTWSVPVC